MEKIWNGPVRHYRRLQADLDSAKQSREVLQREMWGFAGNMDEMKQF